MNIRKQVTQFNLIINGLLLTAVIGSSGALAHEEVPLEGSLPSKTEGVLRPSLTVDPGLNPVLRFGRDGVSVVHWRGKTWKSLGPPIQYTSGPSIGADAQKRLYFCGLGNYAGTGAPNVLRWRGKSWLSICGNIAAETGGGSGGGNGGSDNNGGGGNVARDKSTWWQPQPDASWQIQYSDDLDTSLNVQIYNIDLFDTPQETIDALHAQGKKVICYLSAGTYENWRPDAEKFTPDLLGNNVSGWSGEQWLDIRRQEVLNIMKARIALAAVKHCDAVDPDNVDNYTNPTGFPLTSQDQLTYNKALAIFAHEQGLAISLKNDLEQITDLLPYFDFAVNEECFDYNECSLLRPFIEAGKAVFGIEYDLDPSQFCAEANQMGFNFLQKTLDLTAWRVACR